jgi:NLR family CARD domain-containing protein 3
MFLRDDGNRVQSQLGEDSPTASYWLLMTRDVLPDSRDKWYADQEQLVAEHASRTGLPYEVPKALETATAILMHHVWDGERLYSDNPWTYTRCRELIPHQFNEYPVVVGCFMSSGFGVGHACYDSYSHGVASCQKSF